jgi:hypothetical protein
MKQLWDGIVTESQLHLVLSKLFGSHQDGAHAYRVRRPAVLPFFNSEFTLDDLLELLFFSINETPLWSLHYYYYSNRLYLSRSSTVFSSEGSGAELQVSVMRQPGSMFAL